MRLHTQLEACLLQVVCVRVSDLVYQCSICGHEALFSPLTVVVRIGQAPAYCLFYLHAGLLVTEEYEAVDLYSRWLDAVVRHVIVEYLAAVRKINE